MRLSSLAAARDRAGRGATESPADGPDGALRAVVDALETDIVFGRLLPRERLVEDELVTRFGAKRHVVRQALVELERMGLVNRARNRGAAVADFNPDQVEQIYAVRRLLETGAAAQIPMPLAAARLRTLRGIQRVHDLAVKGGDTLRAFRANNDFHRALFSSCGNAYLTEAIGYFAQKTHVIRSYSIARPEYLRRARDEHWAMIEALKSGDRKELVKLCGDHLNISKLPYIEAYRARVTT
ncbi:MAG: GntR family transcriptional regulator [Casimicrobiaceae bacterium]